MKNAYSCSACGFSAGKWFGRCPECGEWSTAGAATAEAALEVVTLGAPAAAPVRRATGLDELDRVLGGGLVPGSVVLLAGEPGIGKSTLVLQVLDALNGSCASLLVTGEESVEQVGMRAARLGLDGKGLKIAPSTSLRAVIAACETHRPDVLVVDSIQTLHDESIDGTAGSPLQVRSAAARLVEIAKGARVTVILVGHVTKEGTVAGPKTLEHVVDAVLTLEGERSGRLRLLRATKNRFGPCDETGVFVMVDKGLAPVPDPSAMFLEDRHADVPGSVVLPTLDGTRPVLVEVQALVKETDLPNARRVPIGLDARRLTMMIGILQMRAQLDLAKQDVFVAAAGGLNVKEPAADLAMCLAIYSALNDNVLDARTVVFGEVGLAGEVRSVHSLERRLAEAARMGFETALVPKKGTKDVEGLRVIGVRDIREAIENAPWMRDSAEVVTLPARA